MTGEVAAGLYAAAATSLHTLSYITGRARGSAPAELAWTLQRRITHPWAYTLLMRHPACLLVTTLSVWLALVALAPLRALVALARLAVHRLLQAAARRYGPPAPEGDLQQEKTR